MPLMAQCNLSDFDAKFLKKKKKPKITKPTEAEKNFARPPVGKR